MKKITFAVIFSLIIFGLGFTNYAQALGEPIPGIDIVVKKNPGGDIHITAQTGTDGSYNLTGLEPGNYDISILGQPVQTITVGANGIISGKVVSDDLGKPRLVALGAGAVAAILWATTVTSADLGVDNVGTLPTSFFYFFKQWGRGIDRLFTWREVSRVKLELSITNQTAAELLEVEKKNPDNIKAIDNALQNFTNAQERLNTRLANLTQTSENQNIAELLKKVDEKTVLQTALLNQLSGVCFTRTGTCGAFGIVNAQNNIQKTFTAVGEKSADVKQKATDEIVRAGVAIGEANNALMQVTTTRGINVNPGGVDVRGSGKVVETIDEQSSIFDRWGNMIANAKSHLEEAKTAFADGKYGEAYGQARSAEAMVPVLASGQNFPDKKVDIIIPIIPSAETKTKLNINTNKEPAKVLENNSPLPTEQKPIEQKDESKSTPTSTESTSEKAETSPSSVIEPTTLTPDSTSSSGTAPTSAETPGRNSMGR